MHFCASMSHLSACEGQNVQLAGKLQPLQVPESRFDSWSMDFITHLLECGGFNRIYTCVERLTKLVRLTPVKEAELGA